MDNWEERIEGVRADAQCTRGGTVQTCQSWDEGHVHVEEIQDIASRNIKWWKTV